MTDFLGNVPVSIVFLVFQSVLLRPIVFDQLIPCPVLECYGVGHGWLFRLVDRIEYFEGFDPHEFVVSVDEKPNLVWFAVLGDCHVDVGHCGDLFLVSDEGDLGFGDVIFVEEPLNVEACEIWRGVVDNDDMVIGVVLVEDALQVVLIPEVFGVVVGGYDDAEGQFFSVLAQVVLLLQPHLFLLRVFLQLLQFGFCGKDALDVALEELPVAPHRFVAEVGVFGQGFHLVELHFSHFLPHHLLYVLKQLTLLGQDVLQSEQSLVWAECTEFLSTVIELVVKSVGLGDFIKLVLDPFEVIFDDRDHQLIIIVVVIF